VFRRHANIPRKRQGLAIQASMEGLTGTRDEIIADQITDAMKVMAITKTAMAARATVLRERDIPASGIRRRWGRTGLTGTKRFCPGVLAARGFADRLPARGPQVLAKPADKWRTPAAVI
jgi:hypothetical protein